MKTLTFAALLVGAGVSFASAQPVVRISEFLAANSSVVVPNRVGSSFDDWIEIHNAGSETADLGGWRLTDNAANHDKWAFPAGTTLAAGGYLIVLANGANTPDANGNLQTNFSLSASGEFLGLIDASGAVVSEFGPDGTDYPPQSPNISYGLSPADLSSVYFSTPTPGAANSTSGFVRVEPVVVSAGRGYYTAPFNLALSTPTADASIYYTLNGSPPLNGNGTPAPSATLYSAPVTIASTTILRVAGTKAGAASTPITTHSYIFPQAVATQTRPDGYPTTWGNGVGGDYEVDQRVSLSQVDRQRFLDGLRDLPTLSVATSRDALFGIGGLYVNPQSHDEKAVSAEYFHSSPDADGSAGSLQFQIDCGIRMQGGASRNAIHRKHSMSLRFRSMYGKAKLAAPLFGEPALTEFDSLQLRAVYNNSWIHSFPDQRARGTLITDQWVRDSHVAMGNDDGGSGSYVHLFLNGMYWGVYNLHERPENDHFAKYSNDRYDADEVFGLNPGNYTTAEMTSFNQMRNAVASRNWEAVKARLDVDSYIDFYIGQHFAHNDDLKANDNWRAAGGGPAEAPWRFYPWDSERTLENPGNVNPLVISQDGANIISDLIQIPEFRIRFADRAYKHLNHGGALTNTANRLRYLARVAELDRAIVGESARWGDVKTPSSAYLRAPDWLAAVYGSPNGGIVGNNGWFTASGSNRTQTVIDAWKSQTWGTGLPTKLPSNDPPQFMVNGSLQHGGTLADGSVLTFSGGTGEIYYTTDGSDPRLEGGAVKAGLIAYPGGPITDMGSGLLRVRWKNGNNWSALNEAQFITGSPAGPGQLRIVELHYHPAETSARERVAAAVLAGAPLYTRDDYQFLEIQNVSNVTVNLMDCQLTVGVEFKFGNVPLAPGERTVVAERPNAFAIRYPRAAPPAGRWAGALARNGETVTLLSAGASIIDSVTYDDVAPWPSRPDGDGPSLEIIDVAGAAGDASNWRAGSEYHGSPGTAGLGRDGRILINEILSNAPTPLNDTIELVNTSSSPVDLSGWFLSDTKTQYRKFRIPEGTVLAAGDYVVFDESDFNNTSLREVAGYAASGAGSTQVTSPAHGLSTGDTVTVSGYGGMGLYNGTWQVIATSSDAFVIEVPFGDNAAEKGSWTHGQPFALGSLGEALWLMEGTDAGELVRFVDDVDFPASLPGESIGRWPDAEGPLMLLKQTTFGSSNAPPKGASGEPASIVLADLEQVFDGTARLVTYTTDPPGLDVAITYDGSSTPPVAAGSYAVEAMIDDPLYEGSSTGNLVIEKATALVDLQGLSHTYDGTAKTPGVSTTPAGLDVEVDYEGISEPPAAAGTYTVTVTINDSNYDGSATGELIIAKAAATVEIHGLAAIYDGTAKTVVVSTSPTGLEVGVLYNGFSSAPVEAGFHPVVVNVLDPNYEGSASAIFHIAIPDSTYDLWKERRFSTAQVLAGEDGTDADPDHDGLTNFAEYALGGDPNEFTPPLDMELGADRLSLTFQRPKGRTGIVYHADSSSDLALWLAAELEVIGETDTTETVRAHVARLGDRGALWLRLRFEPED